MYLFGAQRAHASAFSTSAPPNPYGNYARQPGAQYTDPEYDRYMQQQHRMMQQQQQWGVSSTNPVASAPYAHSSSTAQLNQPLLFDVENGEGPQQGPGLIL